MRRWWRNLKLRIARWCVADTDWVLSLQGWRESVGLNGYAQLCHRASVNGGWWHDIETGAPLQRNHGELLLLMVSELVEAFEGIRKGLMDDKLPHRRMVEVELADAMIRLFDYAGAKDELHNGQAIDLDGAFHEKLAFNAVREDHKPENRRKVGGKKF